MKVLLISVVWAAVVTAQVQVKGRFQETAAQLFFQKSTDILKLYQPSQKPDNEALRAEEIVAEGKVTKPYKFAESLDLEIDISKDGSWDDIKAIDGTPLKIWQAIVASDNALSLSLHFNEFHLPDGAEFYIRNRESMLGAFTAQINNREDGNFSTVPIQGDFLGLLVAVPAEKNLNELKFKTAKIAHGFRGFPRSAHDFEDSGTCNIDVACENRPGFNHIRAVAMMVIDNGTRFCSGTMINNSALNRRQLFITSDHCMIADPSSFVAVFNYQALTCNGTLEEEPSTLQSAAGMRLLAKWTPGDMALLEIIEPIPNEYDVYLAGWSVVRTPFIGVHGIHHPRCDIKKISYFNGRLVADAWEELPRRLHWKVTGWTRGTTEPGSSGSGLFNAKGQLIGHLHGGLASCEYPAGFDLYGGIVHGWTGGGSKFTRLRDHLNPRSLLISSINGMNLKRP